MVIPAVSSVPSAVTFSLDGYAFTIDTFTFAGFFVSLLTSIFLGSDKFPALSIVYAVITLVPSAVISILFGAFPITVCSAISFVPET